MRMKLEYNLFLRVCDEQESIGNQGNKLLWIPMKTDDCDLFSIYITDGQLFAK